MCPARPRHGGPGKRAGLLVLNADPTADIGNLRDLSMVAPYGRHTVDKRRRATNGAQPALEAAA
ncbi:hypothetical protein GCM10023082_33780 [Streptomyces tremellae]|uniref:Uncharacterized protein n=1 Tax=Streptomyces tremellae TaxID=1124239 RepID=A0ABP7FBW4_9ACTN